VDNAGAGTAAYRGQPAFWAKVAELRAILGEETGERSE